MIALLLAFQLGLVMVGVKVVYVQVLGAAALRDQAMRERSTEATLPALRGSIYDRNLAPLALSVQRHTVVADPILISEPLIVAEKLSPILGVDPGVLLPRLEGDSGFSYVVRGVDDALAQQVRSLSLPGIDVIPETQRSYPAGELAAAALGFTGTDGSGLEGLEYQYNDMLEGRPGRVAEERDPAGQPIAQAPSVLIPSIPGSSLVLTLDEELQYQVEQILDAGVQQYHSKGGWAVVMDPRSGEILALANSPGFSPSDFAKVAAADRHNRAVTDVFEPGSTNKVITIAAALEDKVVGLSQRFDVPDHLRVEDAEFGDAEKHDPVSMNMEDILVESSNVGTIKIAKLVGGQRLDRYFTSFGYGRATGLGFPGEADGLVLPYSQWSGTSIATIPLGQGIAVSALQLTLVYATIANGGVRPVPSLVKAVRSPDGSVAPMKSSGPDEGPRRVISSNTAYSLRHMLGEVVARGTGTRAAVDGYSVAGKTGTARIPSPSGYTNDHVVSFVGFAPAEDPQLVISVSLDRPTDTSLFGGDTAAPLFSEIATFALRHLRIPPTNVSPRPSSGKPDLGA
jgi:cell division protein FtsI (penicillin-binding protein 3)